MSSGSNIEWTETTWNPVTGCDRISPGCGGCYALSMAKRLKAMGSAKYQVDGDPRTSGPGFGVSVHPDVLTQPLRWREPRKVFVNSMSDLAHARVDRDFVAEVFAVMLAARQHTFQVLTKRPKRLQRLLADKEFRAAVARRATSYGVAGELESSPWPVPNVWLGTSIEADAYCWRADTLRSTAAAVRFLSLEPLLGPLPSLDLTDIDWVIAGGESGPTARPMHPTWVRSIRDQCQRLGVAFFFKQWGSWQLVDEHPPAGDPTGQLPHRRPSRVTQTGAVGSPTDWVPGDAIMMRTRPALAGRQLDGRVWDQYPVMPTGQRT